MERARIINSVETCRANGWGAGTRLVGDEGFGPTIIEITAIGERTVLAKTITHNGEEPKFWSRESSWDLSGRNWKLVEGAS